MFKFDFVSLNLVFGFLNSFNFIFLNRMNKGYIKLNTKNIFQSSGILKRLRKTPRKTKAPIPIPILIKFLSKKLFEFFKK
ncbi:hypothetical protein CEE44_02305 [Candidatus Woesearchaeota archaeon B3_Woes]|nr:MAG: hypothetical protein CEE44_02305 [Candidatus Woesearchaeota archaeon B3_Woes]